MKATEQYFPVVLFIMLYKVVLTFESVDDHPMVLPFKSGAPNENIVQNHLNIALLNVLF